MPTTSTSPSSSSSVVSWLIGGRDPHTFYRTGEGHRCKPFIVHGLDVSGIWTSEDMARAVAEKQLRHNVDLNIVRYDGEKRVSHGEPGEVVKSEEMATCMKAGWSVRFLRPHEHVAKVSHIIASMEETFLCHCGANTYWTAARSQGFAPHFDDVDVFIVQTEGEKEWFVYDCDILPRYSSEDFSQKEMPKPSMHLVLKPGDMLFLPRGVIHQARASSGSRHSLHITFSANQCHTYADYLHVLAKTVVEKMAGDLRDLRRDIPHGVTETLGALRPALPASSPHDAATLQTFIKEVHGYVDMFAQRAKSRVSVEHAMDVFVKNLMPRRQPPPQASTTEGGENGEEVTLDTCLRPVTRTAARLCLEAGECRVYYLHPDVDSSERTECVLRFEQCFAPAVAMLLASYPSYVKVSELPMVMEGQEDEDEDVDADEAMTEEDANENRLVLAESLLATTMFVRKPLRRRAREDDRSASATTTSSGVNGGNSCKKKKKAKMMNK